MPTAIKQEERPTAPTDDWMSLPAAARALGVTRPTVIAWALKGLLITTTVAGRIVVARESVEAQLRAREAAR